MASSKFIGMKIIYVSIAALVILLFAGTAFAQDAIVQQYSEAMAKSREGSPGLAVKLLLDIARLNPEHHIADDALFQAGNIAEKKLALYDKAQEAYLSVLEKYPKSKNARRARKRFEYLKEARSSGDEPLKIYTRIMQDLPQMGLEKGIEVMIDLYKRFPGFHRRDQVLYWIAENKRRLNLFEDSVIYYQALIQNHPDSKWAYFSMEKVGQVYIELREFDKAIEIFEKLSAYESRQPGAKRSSMQLISIAKRFQTLRLINFISIGIILLALFLWTVGTKWKNITKAILLSSVTDVILITSFIVLGFYFTFKDMAAFKIPYWIVAAVAAPCSFIFAFSRKKETLGKNELILKSSWFTYRVLYSITATFGILFILLNPTIFRTTTLYLGLAIGLFAFCNHLFIKTRGFPTSVKIILGAFFFFISAALVYVVYYQSDVINLLYDSIIYGRKTGGLK